MFKHQIGSALELVARVLELPRQGLSGQILRPTASDPVGWNCTSGAAVYSPGMKKIISTSEAPAALGPYSQAVRVGDTIYCAGQIPLDPKSGEIVTGGIEVQTRRVLDNITAVLKAEGLGFANIVKTTIFLMDLGDFQKVNEIYGSYFSQQPPARSTVQVAGLPKGARVEIEVIAVAGAAAGGGVASDTSG